MNDLTVLTDEATKKVEAGQIAWHQMVQELTETHEALTQARERIKMMELEIDSMGKQILRAEQDREIALGRKDEAEHAHVAIRTKLEAIISIAKEYEPKPKMNGAAELGAAAVAGAVIQKDGRNQ